MKARLEFIHKDGNQRWFRLTLTDDWPTGWTVPYADLLTADLMKYFETSPPNPDGLSPDVNYQMSSTFVNEDFAIFCKLLTELIGTVKPPSPVTPGVDYTYVVDYD